jgi:uncharacterized membrane protein
MLTQAIRDLPEVLTQANIRILLRILEGEIQSYGTKFGMDLARTLHTLEPRYAYVFDSGEQLYCQFRPTLSLPRGIEDFGIIREHSKSRVALEEFTTQTTLSQTSPKETLPKPDLVQSQVGIDSLPTEDEKLLLEKLEELGGSARSKRVLQMKLGVGRQKIIDLVQKLETKGILETKKIQNRASIRLKKERPPNNFSTERGQDFPAEMLHH